MEEFDFNEFKEPEGSDDNVLAQVSAAVSQWETLSIEMDELEKQLKEKNAELKHMAENVMPELMVQAQQAECTSLGGFKVKLKEIIVAHVPSASAKEPDQIKRRWEAFRWLDNNGYGDLIERKIDVTFDRKDETAAKELLTKLKADNYQARPNYNLHHMRLQGFVRQAFDEGVDVPEDIFAIRSIKRCEVRSPRGKLLRLPKSQDE